MSTQFATQVIRRTVLAKGRSCLSFYCIANIQHPGGFKDDSDALLATAGDISRACRIPIREANTIISLICREHAQPLRPLQAFLSEPNESFTTGDSELDSILGGGITTGMVWEVVGERYLRYAAVLWVS